MSEEIIDKLASDLRHYRKIVFTYQILGEDPNYDGSNPSRDLIHDKIAKICQEITGSYMLKINVDNHNDGILHHFAAWMNIGIRRLSAVPEHYYWAIDQLEAELQNKFTQKGLKYEVKIKIDANN
jgi:hypothetical protein